MNALQDLLSTNKPVLVDFSAKWCGPCRIMEPILEELRVKVGDVAIVVKVDVDQYPHLAEEYQIRAVPTLVLFINQQQVWRQSGVFPADYLEQIIAMHKPVVPFPSA